MNRSLVALLLLPAVALAAPVPKVKQGENKLYVTIGGTVVKMNPDGSDEERLFDDRHTGHDIGISPDGKRVLSRTTESRGVRVVIATREAGGEPVELAKLGHMSAATWAEDGKSLSLREMDDDPKVGTVWKHRRIDSKSGKELPSADPPDTPKGYELWKEGKDQRYYTRMDGILKGQNGANYGRAELVVTPVAKLDPTVLIAADLNVYPLAQFPDGKRWLVKRIDDPRWGVYTVGEREVEFWEKWDRAPVVFAISPSGTSVAYSFPVGTGSSLWTADADGKNAERIGRVDKRISRIDWR